MVGKGLWACGRLKWNRGLGRRLDAKGKYGCYNCSNRSVDDVMGRPRYRGGYEKGKY